MYVRYIMLLLDNSPNSTPKFLFVFLVCIEIDLLEFYVSQLVDNYTCYDVSFRYFAIFA